MGVWIVYAWMCALILLKLLALQISLQIEYALAQHTDFQSFIHNTAGGPQW